MDFQLEESFVTEHELSEDVVAKINEIGNSAVAEATKAATGQASANADKIIDGALSKLSKSLGIERNKGEQLTEFVDRAWNESSSSRMKEIDDQKAELEKKLAEFKGNETLSAEFAELKGKYSDLQKEAAEYTKLIESGIPEKYEELQGKYGQLKLEVAFGQAQPKFADGVNEYEAKYKWDEVKADVLSKWNIEIVDGEAIGINKENEHLREKLSAIIGKYDSIKALVKGREQRGSGAKPEDEITIKDVPFKVKKDATSAERATAIREYLAKKGIDPMHRDYTKLFGQYNSAILANVKED